MGQQNSLRTQLVAKIVDGPETIDALTMTGDIVTFTVTSAKFHEDPLRLLSKRKAQIQPPLPEFSAGFELLPCIPVQARRRRHSTKQSVDQHGFQCSYVILSSRLVTNFPTIESKFSRMRKTGVKNP